MAKDFWNKYSKPIIGLSPMEGYTDSAMRSICKLINPNIIVFTEFTSADGLYNAFDKLKKKLYFSEQEHPIIAQIYGKNIETFQKAAKLCEQLGFDGIDLNMGCPAKKVVKSEQGIALRKKKDLAFKLIEVVAKSTNLPVSVKTRLGWSDASDLIEFGIGAQNAGANMLIIHGRTYLQPYGVPANLEPIYELKRFVKIPVLGNGGILDIQDGLNKLGNLDGFLIGQAAIGNPWVFCQDRSLMPKNFIQKIPIIKKHIQIFQQIHKYVEEQKAVLPLRKHLLAYIKGFYNASIYRAKFSKVTTFIDIYKILDELQNLES